MSGTRRVARLNEQLKREIAELLRTRLSDPRVADVTITGVRVTPDLSIARVHAVWPEDSELDVMGGLAAITPFLRRALSETLELRRVPEIRFFEDRSEDRARRIHDILREVLPEEDAEGEEKEIAAVMDADPAELDPRGVGTTDPDATDADPEEPSGE